jgi:transposase-like protein
MSVTLPRFTQEFKDELCREVISASKSIKEVGHPYGVGPETLRNWLHDSARSSSDLPGPPILAMQHLHVQ